MKLRKVLNSSNVKVLRSANQVLSVTKVPQCKTNKRSGKLVVSS